MRSRADHVVLTSYGERAAILYTCGVQYIHFLIFISVPNIILVLVQCSAHLDPLWPDREPIWPRRIPQNALVKVPKWFSGCCWPLGCDALKYIFDILYGLHSKGQNTNVTGQLAHINYVVLLAPQSGAHTIAPHRDPSIQPNPIQSHLKLPSISAPIYGEWMIS